MLQPRPCVVHGTGSVPSPNGQLLHAHQRSLGAPTQVHRFVSPLGCGIEHDSSPGAHGELVAQVVTAADPLPLPLPLPSPDPSSST
jgi:hypothetical protein